MPPVSREPARSSLARRLRLAAIPLAMLLATGCTGEAAKWERGGWPEPVTDQGKKVLGVWQGALIASLVIGGGMLILIVGAAILYRRKSPDQLPRQVRYNLPIEVLYTFIPVVIVAVLFYFTALRESDENRIHPNDGSMPLEVVGFQWSWQFNYLQDGLSITGRPGQPPTLVLPVGKEIHFYEKSPDVIHSFWVIPFLFKRDVIPGRTNEFELKVTQTGTFKGKCAEYCGVDHSRMLFNVRALSPADYQTWLAGAKKAAAAGSDPELTVYTGPTQEKVPS